jgi:cytochrome P450
MSYKRASSDVETSQCCAWLCSAEGQPFQREAYDAILEAYGGDRDQAWKMAFEEENVPLIVSLYKETLRFFATSPFNNRRVSKEIKIYDTVIPKGMMVILNQQAVNHDPDFYKDATTFNPRRFVDNLTPTPHLSYGIGSRICPAYQISNRIMSAMLTRLILAFEIKQVEGTRLPNIDMIDFSDAYGLVALPRAYDCSFVARDETWLGGKMAI